MITLESLKMTIKSIISYIDMKNKSLSKKIDNVNSNLPHKLSDLENDLYYNDPDSGSKKLIDEKYISDEIARISELPQSDWNQSDKTAADYVKNKPFYDESTIVTREFKVGNSDTPEKIYDTAFTQLLYDNYQTATYKFGNEVGYCSPMNKYDTHVTFTVNIDSDYVYFIVDIYNGYIQVSNRSVSQGRERLYISIGEVEIHQLDEKFIPNTIARLDDIPQPDWNQIEETAPDYIKNRTHGVRKEVIIDDPNANLVSKDTDVRECTYTFASSITLVPVADYTLVVNGVSAKGVCNGLHPAHIPFTVNGGEWIIYEDRAEIKLPYKESNYHVTLIGSNEEIYQLDEKYIPDTIARISDVDEAIANACQVQFITWEAED